MAEYTMRQAADIIRHAIEYPLTNGQHRVVYLEGDPGIGKTAMMYGIYMRYRRYRDDYIKQAIYWKMKDSGVLVMSKPNAPENYEEIDNILNAGGFTHFVAYVAPEREPTDWGLPYPNAERTAIDMLPLKDFMFAPTDRPFIFLDEIDKANNMMQNVLGRVMHEQKVGNIVFPVGTFVAAAGNKLTNRAGGFNANSHIKNRRTHVPLTVSAEEWIEDVGIPFDLHSSVVSYIRTDHKALHIFDGGAPSFPSPRSWTKVGLELNRKMAEHVERALIEGDIGVGASNSFWGHLKIFRSIRSPEEVIANPTKVKVPEGKDAVAIMYAEITSLARYAKKENAEAIFTYFNRVPKEYSFVGYRDVMQRDKSTLVASKAGQRWVVENSTLLTNTKAKA